MNTEYSYNEKNIDGLEYNQQKFTNLIDSLILPDKNSAPKILKKKPPYEDISKLINIAEYIKDHFEHLVIIGMGGAILNPMAILAFRNPKENKIKISFLYTVEADKILSLMANVDLNKTAFLIISKSGETIETIALFITWLQKYKEFNIPNLQQHFYFIVGKNDNTLRKAASELDCIIFDHDESIGGRYATFSNVGLLPALVAGIDIKSFCQGAEQTLNTFFSQGINSPSAKGGKFLAIMYSQKKKISVTMSYMHLLHDFLQWQSQIVAESLGKNNKGITPIPVMGPIDHHSQLQLYLDGPKDKFFTLIYNSPNDIHDIMMHDSNISPNLNSTSLNTLLKATYLAALQSIKLNNLPVRTILFNDFDISSLGSIMMHFIIETIVAGKLMGVNPFNQPAVMQVKEHLLKLLNAN